jgi:hypothetical protein
VTCCGRTRRRSRSICARTTGRGDPHCRRKTPPPAATATHHPRHHSLGAPVGSSSTARTTGDGETSESGTFRLRKLPTRRCGLQRARGARGDACRRRGAAAAQTMRKRQAASRAMQRFRVQRGKPRNMQRWPRAATRPCAPVFSHGSLAGWPPTDNVRRTTCNRQRTTGNGQHATDDMQQTTCNGQQTTGNLQRTTCNGKQRAEPCANVPRAAMGPPGVL